MRARGPAAARSHVVLAPPNIRLRRLVAGTSLTHSR
jgi:hypothetical protein